MRKPKRGERAPTVICCSGAASAQSSWATFLMALTGFGLALHKERWPRFAYGFNVAMLTFPIVAIPGARPALDFLCTRMHARPACTETHRQLHASSCEPFRERPFSDLMTHEGT